jgi:transposase
MPKLDKRCQKSDIGSELDRVGLKILAIDHFKEGKSAKEFAAEYHLPRTTAIGWYQRWRSDNEMVQEGRPRKLPPFNESKVLETLRAERVFHDWKSTRDLIRAQSGEVLGRRTILRLLERWGITAGRPDRRDFCLVFSSWVQPEVTIHRGAAQRGTLWRLLSGRGMEGFALTHGASKADAERVAKALIDRVGRSKPGWLKEVLERLQRDFQ